MAQYHQGHQGPPRGATNYGEGVSKEELVKLVETWRQRKVLCEEVDLLEQRGGMAWIEQGLQTNFKTGISSNSIEWRTSTFGSNEIASKPPDSSVD